MEQSGPMRAGGARASRKNGFFRCSSFSRESRPPYLKLAPRGRRSDRALSSRARRRAPFRRGRRDRQRARCPPDGATRDERLHLHLFGAKAHDAGKGRHRSVLINVTRPHDAEHPVEPGQLDMRRQRARERGAMDGPPMHDLEGHIAGAPDAILHGHRPRELGASLSSSRRRESQVTVRWATPRCPRSRPGSSQVTVRWLAPSQVTVR